MPDKMKIRIRVDQIDDTTYQTVSTFAIDEKGKVTFRNDAAKLATIEFQNKSPFCQGGQPEPLTFEIQAGDKSTHTVCKDIANQQFKYTATVADALPEDPILIIESISIGSTDSTPILIIEWMPPLIGGLLVGAFVGFLFGRRLTAQSRPR